MNVSAHKLKKLESFYEELSYTIRYEKGNFRSGHCIMKDRNIVLINRFFDREGRYFKLLSILSELLEDGDIPDSEVAKTQKWLTELQPLLNAEDS